MDFPIPNHAIRPATDRDVLEIARLLAALGYPAAEDVMTIRFAEWRAAGNTALVAATADGRLLGVATLHQMIVLHRPRPVGRITSLVVDAAVRGQGIGRALVAAAEAALAGSGCGLLEVTSNLRRMDAHAFYARLGYEQTSMRFAKVLVTAD